MDRGTWFGAAKRRRAIGPKSHETGRSAAADEAAAPPPEAAAEPVGPVSGPKTSVRHGVRATCVGLERPLNTARPRPKGCGDAGVWTSVAARLTAVPVILAARGAVAWGEGDAPTGG